MVLVCAPGHRLAKCERLALEDLHGLDMIGFDADLEIRSEIDRALAAHSVEVRVAMEFDNIVLGLNEVALAWALDWRVARNCDHRLGDRRLAQRRRRLEQTPAHQVDRALEQLAQQII